MVGVVSKNGQIQIISVGTQGPQGPAGPAGGSGGITISPVAPLNPLLADQWLDTSVTPNQMNVWSGVDWDEYVYKSELASATGNLLIETGYF